MNKFSIEYAIDFRSRIKDESDKSLRIISCYQQDQFHFPEQNILPSPRHITTEGLGFTGRREGIAAQAIATVELPGS